MEENRERVTKSWIRILQRQMLLLFSLVVLLWLIELVDAVLPAIRMDQWGIRPREINGLWGIVWAPFLHAGFGHLGANTVPFLVLGWFVLLRGIRPFLFVSLTVMMVSGFGTWLIAPANTLHIGASGLIFGYFGYLLLRGYFERSLSALLWAILVVVLYGGLLWGVVPQGPGISWQGHLFGFVGGGLAAYWLRSGREVG
jgi:membrane associated rhomboid family serine protease